MANLNKVLLIGNLTRDPELKYTPKGTAIAAFNIAVNRSYTTETGEKREEVTFIGIEAYGRVAEVIGEYCKKGHPIFIEGRLKLDTWDDQTTGQKKSKTKVVCENMQLLGGRGGGVSPQTAEQADSAAAGRGGSASAPPVERPPRPPAQRPPADPDLDAAPDDIPF